MPQFWNESTQRLEPTYWCPITGDWTDPPIPKSNRHMKSRTHVLLDGKAACGKPSPAWFHRPEDLPTCEKCLSHLTQSYREALQ